MSYIKTTILACTSLFVVGCAGTFSGSDNAYLKDSQALPPVQGSNGVKLKQEKQYLPVVDITADQDYQSPSLLPPGERLSTRSKVIIIGSNGSVLIVREKLPVVWKQLALALSKTPYSIMDRDESFHSYFLVDKVETGGSINRSSPIYQLVLSSKGEVTELHLLDSKNRNLDKAIASRIMLAIEENYV